MRMRICTHGQQAGGEEINQTSYISAPFSLQTIHAPLDKSFLLRD